MVLITIINLIMNKEERNPKTMTEIKQGKILIMTQIIIMTQHTTAQSPSYNATPF